MKYIEQRSNDYLWACPCGLVAPYFNLCGHRKGIKNRPSCTGQITLVGPVPSNPAEAVSETVESVTGERQAPEMLFVGKPDEVDAEELARRYNEQRNSVLDPPRTNGHNGNGHGYVANEDLAGTVELSAGDWRIEHPPGVPDFSQASVNIRLPVKVQNYYDWCKANGWGKGLSDPSISVFMVDVVLEHMEGCLGLAVYIGKREEVMNG